MTNPPVTFAPILNLIQQFSGGLRNITGADEPVIEIVLSGEVYDRLIHEGQNSLMLYHKKAVSDCAVVCGIKVKRKSEL